MTTWGELNGVLLELESPGALVQHPDPHVDDNRQPPFEIHLLLRATDIAEELHDRFDGVELVFVSLRYPQRPPRMQPTDV